MKAEITIRRGDQRDRAFILDLGGRTVMDSVSSFREAIPAMVRLSYERLAEYVFGQPHVALIAADGETRAGFLLLLESLPDEVTLTPQAFVAYMAVEAAFRRRGIGEALLREAERIARERNLPCLAMMVTEENEPARRLYERAGYLTERRLLCKRM